MPTERVAEPPEQIVVPPEAVTIGAAVVMPVKSLDVVVTVVDVRVWVLVLVAPNFTHGKLPEYWPIDMLASVPVTSPVT